MKPVREIRQHSQGECGLMAVLMMADGFGLRHDVPTARDQFGIGARGIDMAGLVAIASELGLSARAVRLDMDELHTIPLPAVLHWGLDHFVTLVQVTSTHLVVIDPAAGRRRVTLAEASKRVSGVALLTEGVTAKKPLGKSGKAEDRSVGWLDVLSMGRNRLPALLAVALALEALTLCVPQVGQIMIDGVLAGNDRDLVMTVVTGFVVVSLVAGLLTFAKLRILLANNSEGRMLIGSRMAHHLLHAPLRWAEGRGSGDILNRFNAMGQLQASASTATMSSMLDGLVSVIAAGLMMVLSPLLGSIALCFIAVSLGIRVATVRYMQQQSGERLVAVAMEQTHLIDTVRGLQSVKLAGAERHRFGRWQSLLVRRLNVDSRIAQRGSIADAAVSVISGIDNVVIYGLGCLSVMASSGAGLADGQDLFMSIGLGTTGSLVAFVAYKQLLSHRLNSFAQALVTLVALRPALDQANDLFNAPADASLASVGDHGSEKAAYDVEFRNVSFRHSSHSTWILRDVSFKVNAGSSLIVMGPSGSGKTTLAKLMLGVLRPTSGQVLIDGVDLETKAAGSTRLRCSAVLQEDQLFGASVRENVSMRDEEHGAKVEAACRSAGLHDEISAMPMGYRTRVGEGGTGISGGQKQRLLLARALYRDPALLVLDEGTSALDVKTEQRLLANVNALPCTKVFITHHPRGLEGGAQVLMVANGRAGLVGAAARPLVTNPTAVVASEAA